MSISRAPFGVFRHDAVGESPQDTLNDPGAPLYTVGVVAEVVGVDPQVVRGYDRRGIIEPTRSDSGQRRCSRNDVARLSRAIALADEGVSTPGIERVLALEDQMAAQEDGDAAS